MKCENRRLQVSFGLWWLYEDFDLDDFQSDGLKPYGADFLTVDDATRYLFLDSRYADYTAHVAQVFVRFNYWVGTEGLPARTRSRVTQRW